MIPPLVFILAMGVGSVRLRSGEQIAAERVAAVSVQGVELKPGFTDGLPARVFVPWSDVLTIENGWSGAEAFRTLADAVGRAEGRIARGDFAGAGAVLEPLGAEHLPLRGPTSATIASALVMIRVLRDEPVGASRAWLAWRSAPAGPARPWIDAETGLCPSIPPVWERSAAGEFLSTDLAGLGLDETAATLAAHYANAARAALGSAAHDAPDADARSKADPGVRLVAEIVRVQVESDPAAMAAARDGLRRRVRAGGPAWQDAWCRLGLGVSMLNDEDRLEADAGAGELVAVLIEHRLTAPGLADLARRRLIDYFNRTGRPDHARSVEAMDHAALAGLRLRAAPTPDQPMNQETP